MSNWVALSEIVRNIALTFAAVVGAILDWRGVSCRQRRCKRVRLTRKLNWRDVPTSPSCSIERRDNFVIQSSKSG